MAFFRDPTVNLLNLHYGIHAIALSGGGAFFAVYLLEAGVAVPFVLASLALILAGRFVIRPIVVPIAARTGLRAVVIAGTCLTALQYPLLAEVHGIGLPLLALCLVASVGDTFYWSSYHAYFAALGNQEHRGSEVGAREALAALVGIASPLVTGWLLVSFGPGVAFGATSGLLLLAALPLLWTPKVPVPQRAPGVLKAAIPGMRLFLADGWISAGYLLAWQIVLFQSLSENYLAYGGALALAALIGAIAGLLLGRHIDAGHGESAVSYALGTLTVAILLRVLAPESPVLAVIANGIGAIVICLYMPTLMTAVYNQAKRSACTLRFHVATEASWDVGGASGCLVCAALAASGLPLSTVILPSLLGVAALFVLLRRYYSRHPAVTPLAAGDPLAQNAIINLGERVEG